MGGMLMRASGIVFSGLGEGAKYLKVYSRRIRALVGFAPFPGTLNVKIRRTPKIVPDANIPSFGKFGAVNLKKCRVNGEPAWIVIPKKTQHKNVLEIIHAKNLRKKLGLKDKDRVVVEC